MIHILSFLAFLVLQAVDAQDCVPESVRNVTYLENQLKWSPSTNCAQTQYLIYTYVNENDDLRYVHTADSPFLDLLSLSTCNSSQKVFFEILAYSGNALSGGVNFATNISAPSGADFTITSLNATTQERGVHLNWHLSEYSKRCVDFYKVVVQDKFNPNPRDIHTDSNNIFVNNLASCGEYKFEIRAIYDKQQEGPTRSIDYSTPGEVSPRPVVERVDAGDTYASIRWSVPSFDDNRCAIKSMTVDGRPYVHQIFPITDTPSRPHFMMTINSLQPDSMYLFQVTIENSVGTSEVQSIGVHTEPDDWRADSAGSQKTVILV